VDHVTPGREARDAQTAARVGGAMLFTGGLLPIVLALTVESFANGRMVPTFVLGSLAVVCSAFCMAVPQRVPPAGLQLLAPFGTLLITMASALNSSAADGSQLLYIWPVLYVSYFLSIRVALLNVALIALVYPPLAISLLGNQGITPAAYLVGTSVVTMLIVANVRRRLAAVLAASELEARTDRLTGLYNRRAWDESLAHECARQHLLGAPLSVLVLDLDYFKKLNDSRGHAAGDDALARVAGVLRKTARKTDLVARLGGEEFGLLLPGCSTRDAERIAEEVRRNIEQESQHWDCAITVSVGVATVSGQVVDGNRLVQTADEALYAAKRSGRNRVSVSGSV
jgi:diguanylate cyclase (GGDEF)-like protein